MSGPLRRARHEREIELARYVDQSGPYPNIDLLLRFATRVAPLSTRTGRPQLVDMCCGTGRLTRRFAAAGWRVVGIDACAEMTEIAELLHPRHAAPGEYHTTSNPADVPLGDGSSELVVAFDDMAVELCDHSNLVRLLETSRRILSVGAHLLFQLERRDSPPPADTIAAVREAGLTAAWTASSVRLEEPIDVEHRGSRDLFVARRDL